MKSPWSILLPMITPAVVLSLLGLVGCSSGSSAPAAMPGASSDAAAIVDAGVDAEDFMATEATFDCLKGSEWTQVGLSYFKNTLGHTDEMLAVVRSPEGGTLPVGTVVQLIPTEASVKRGPGFSAASHDWEFFSLGVSSTGTTITARGGDAHVVSSLNGASCIGCHGLAAPQWDLLCGDPDGGSTSHGCASLGPLATPANIMSIQSSDPRCP
ncbi:MAG TPA: hypothetical protein VK762_33450 [Polyangiaceae bacterium]|jgi:hypothetical protein|nr:hypothetical protein [Polyangiaceae bacterium]